jgi:hypothetical protein
LREASVPTSKVKPRQKMRNREGLGSWKQRMSLFSLLLHRPCDRQGKDPSDAVPQQRDEQAPLFERVNIDMPIIGGCHQLPS